MWPATAVTACATACTLAPKSIASHGKGPSDGHRSATIAHRATQRRPTTRLQAKVSALMEAAERYSCLRHDRFTVRGSYRDLVRGHNVAHPSAFVVPRSSGIEVVCRGGTVTSTAPVFTSRSR